MTQFDPSNRPTKRPALVLEQREVASLLGVAALALSAVECPQNADGQCVGCNAFRTLFWELSNALDQDMRAWYQEECALRRIPLPAAPWEDVDDTPPTAR